MKNLLILLLIGILWIPHLRGQERMETYKRRLSELKAAGMDTNRVILFNGLSLYHRSIHPDSGIYYASKALSLARKLHYGPGELLALVHLAWATANIGNHSNSLKIALETIKLARQYQMPFEAGLAFACMGENYAATNQTRLALRSYQQALRNYQRADVRSNIAIMQSYLAKTYAKLDLRDSSQMYLNEARHMDKKVGQSWVTEIICKSFSEVFSEFNQLDSALFFQVKSYQIHRDRYRQPLNHGIKSPQQPPEGPPLQFSDSYSWAQNFRMENARTESPPGQ